MSGKKKSAGGPVAAGDTEALRCRRIVETAIEGIWEMDAQSRTTFVNQRMADMMGYSPDEMLVLPAHRFLFEEDFEDHDRKMKARERGEGTVYERRFRRKDGEALWAVVSATPLMDGQGNFVGSFAMFTDITDRKKAEQILLESREHFRLLYEQSPVAYQSLDAEGRFEEVNQAWLDMLGFSRDEVIGRRFDDFVVPHQVEMFLQRFSRVRETESLRGAELDLKHKGGAVISVLIDGRASRDENGNFVRTHCVLHNITDRKRAEQSLRESEGQVRAKLNAILSPEGDIGALELADVVDVQAIQTMMDNFFALTRIGVAIVNLRGKVLVATGWQDVCTKFHRAHPETCKHCIESDTFLSAGVEPGAFKLYRCKNNMWDIVTPITLGDRHAGNLFLGQFLFENEKPDYNVFRAQARQYGFDEKEYLAALDRVPRWSREKVNQVMTFYAGFAKLISELSYGNVKLARTLAERDSLLGQLRASESKYRQLAENTPDIIWQLGLDLRFTYVNPTIQTVLGYTVEEFVGQALERFCSVERLRQINEIIAREMQNLERHTGVVFETEMIHKSGRAVPLEIHGTIQTDGDGKPTGFQGVTRDCTERKRVEEALRQSEDKYRALVETTNTGFLILDAHGKVIDANQDYVRLTGRDALEEILGRSVVEWTASYDLERNAVEVKKCIAQGFVRNLEIDYVNRSGQVTPVEINATVVGSGGSVRILSLCRDITERRRAEEALRESENTLSSLIGNLPGMVYRCANDPNWTMQFVSDGCKDVTGYEVSELAQNRTVAYGDLVHPDDRDWLWNKCQASLQARTPCHNVYRIIARSGETRWVWERATGRYAADGTLLCIEGFVQDITESKQAEEKMKQQVEELRRWHEVTLGREERIAELKREVNELAARMGEKPKYGAGEK